MLLGLIIAVVVLVVAGGAGWFLWGVFEPKGRHRS